MSKIISPKKALEFLDRFDYHRITVAAIAEPSAPIKGFDLRHFKSSKYSKTGKAKISHTFVRSEFNDQLVEELVYLQKIKRAVYFLVNESDGQIRKSSPNTNTKDHILKLTSCFCDTDNCHPNIAIKYFNKMGVSPHIVVETSPKRYHFYFLIQPESLKEVDKWKAIQKTMEWLGESEVDHGMDKTMHDVTQLMRLPGFLHQKRDPFQVNVIKENFHDPYTLDELFYQLKAEKFFTNSTTSRNYEYPARIISEGERHEAFRNYALSVANNTQGDPLSARKVLDAVDGFMIKNFSKSRSFLQGGSRRKEVLRTVQDAVNLANQAIIDTIPPINYEELEEINYDEFAMPDHFFYHCPGIVGEITKYMASNARYPVPSFAWASTVAMLGTLKSPYVTSEFGHAPANYFLCLGPSGTGKNYPQEVLSATLNSLGVPDLAASKVRSARGIETFLEHHNSNGMLSIDEAEGLLASLNDAKTPHHIRNMKELLLELYSKTNTPYFHTGWVGDKKQKATVLKYPRLNLIAYGVVHTLEEAFNEKSIRDGLLQRFIVLTHMKKRERNENFTPAGALNGNFAHALKEILIEAKILTVEVTEKLEKLNRMLKKADTPEKKVRIRQKIDEVQAQLSSTQRKVLPFDADAAELLDKYADKLDQSANYEVGKERGFEGLYTRGAEQVGRLAVAICQEKTINKNLVQYCIDLIDSRIESTRKFAFERLGISRYGFEKERLFRFICKRWHDVHQPVTYRYVSRNYAIENRRMLRDILEGLYEDGRLRMINPGSRGGRGQRGETFIPTDLLDEEVPSDEA